MKCGHCQGKGFNWHEQFSAEAFFEHDASVSEDVTFSWRLYIVNGTNKVISEGKRMTSPFAACWLGFQTAFKYKALFKEWEHFPGSKMCSKEKKIQRSSKKGP